ncbi:hypothetical protein [Paenibacillus sp. DMB20]|nr:hypothetical protein [Paenibacillus sp. DMB20]
MLILSQILSENKQGNLTEEEKKLRGRHTQIGKRTAQFD